MVIVTEVIFNPLIRILRNFVDCKTYNDLSCAKQKCTCQPNGRQDTLQGRREPATLYCRVGSAETRLFTGLPIFEHALLSINRPIRITHNFLNGPCAGFKSIHMTHMYEFMSAGSCITTVSSFLMGHLSSVFISEVCMYN